MNRLHEDVDRNAQEQEEVHEPVSPPHELDLDIQILEERIAPALSANRSETMVAEQQGSEAEVELDIQVLEERIAPGIKFNRSETMVLL